MRSATMKPPLAAGPSRRKLASLTADAERKRTWVEFLTCTGDETTNLRARYRRAIETMDLPNDVKAIIRMWFVSLAVQYQQGAAWNQWLGDKLNMFAQFGGILLSALLLIRDTKQVNDFGVGNYMFWAVILLSVMNNVTQAWLALRNFYEKTRIQDQAFTELNDLFWSYATLSGPFDDMDHEDGFPFFAEAVAALTRAAAKALREAATKGRKSSNGGSGGSSAGSTAASAYPSPRARGAAASAVPAPVAAIDREAMVRERLATHRTLRRDSIEQIGDQIKQAVIRRAEPEITVVAPLSDAASPAAGAPPPRSPSPAAAEAPPPPPPLNERPERAADAARAAREARRMQRLGAGALSEEP